MRIMKANDISRMEKEINTLTNVSSFYDDVRRIVGYHDDNIFIEDWDIKHLQRVADARYEKIGGTL